MPRGRPRTNPTPESNPEEQVLQGQASGDVLQTAGAEQPVAGLESQESDAQDMAGTPAAPQTGPELSGPPETLLSYVAENIRTDIREFMQMFGINGHPPESVYESVMGIAGKVHAEQSAAVTHAGEQELVPAPDQQQAEAPAETPVPLNVRINSLEMDGGTRAFATAEYGDLTIRRIRVKEDGYGALSVSMPKFRQPGGWEETCRFGTVESRNRLSSAVLDAYQQKLAQLQGLAQSQEQDGAMDPDQDPEFEEEQDFDGQDQDVPVMGMSL